VRVLGAPVGTITVPVPSNQTVSAEDLESAVRAQLAPDLERLRKSRQGTSMAFKRDPSRGISVVVPTCGDDRSIVACVRSLFASVSKPDQVVVVENRPEQSGVADALNAAFFGDSRLCYIEEPHPGLSRARNAGLSAATQPLVAFVDDDVLVDPDWLGHLRSAFAEAPEVTCVTGLILPRELETQDQLTFEQFARFGNRFARRTYRLAKPPPGDPLFPYTPGSFGSGGNMAFRTKALLRSGAYDTALGTGTPARGGEELDVFLRLLWGGQALVHEPAAIVWHRHPEGDDQLRRKAFGYGVGLGATLTKTMVNGPQRMAFLRRIPRGLRYLLDPRSDKNRHKGPDFPRSLAWRERLGMLVSPAAYWVSLLSNRKYSNSHLHKAEGWPMTSYQRFVCDVMLLALAIAAFVINAVSLPSLPRAIVTLLAALLVPGWAILTRLNVDGILGLFVIAVALSLTVDTIVSLLLVWTALWSPGTAAIAAGTVAILVIAYDACRNLVRRPHKGLLASQPSSDISA
jgi:GT2 family glycosyltransferase